MKPPMSAFAVTEWNNVPAPEHAGETGFATWQTIAVGDMRVRMVRYSKNYRADHWLRLRRTCTG
jgi:hypothetical protein